MPSATAACSHAPVAGTQPVFAQVESPVVSQMTTVSGSTSQTPASQTNEPLQRSSSSSAAQSPSASHAQSSVTAPAQTPSEQESRVVQPLPSSHGDALTVNTQSPVCGSQASSVQTSSSSQAFAYPSAQAPSTHTVSTWQASSGLHGV